MNKDASLNKKELSQAKEIMTEKGHLEKKEVASLFRKNLTTIDRWVKKGWLTPLKYGSSKQSRVMFNKEEVFNLLLKGAK